MKKIYKLLFGIGLIFLGVTTIFAGAKVSVEKAEKNKNKLPIGCYSMGYKFQYFHLILQPVKKYSHRVIYLVHNTTKNSINLFQEQTGEEPYIMHLNTTIGPNSWSALITDEARIEYICALHDGAATQKKIIRCQNSLEICVYPRPRFGAGDRGNYWAVTNIGSAQGLVRAIVRHGEIPIDNKKEETDNPKG